MAIAKKRKQTELDTLEACRKRMIECAGNTSQSTNKTTEKRMDKTRSCSSQRQGQDLSLCDDLIPEKKDDTMEKGDTTQLTRTDTRKDRDNRSVFSSSTTSSITSIPSIHFFLSFFFSLLIYLCIHSFIHPSICVGGNDKRLHRSFPSSSMDQIRLSAAERKRMGLARRKEKVEYLTYNPTYNTTLYNHTQPYTTLYNHTQPYTTLYNHTQPYTTIHNHTQPYATIHNPIQPYTTIHNHTQPYTTLCNHTYIDIEYHSVYGA